MKPTAKSFKEIREQAHKEFYDATGHYPTIKEAVRLTEEARNEIQEKREQTDAPR